MLPAAQAGEQTGRPAGVATFSRSHSEADAGLWQVSPWYVDPLSTGDVFALPRGVQAWRNRLPGTEEGVVGAGGGVEMTVVGGPTAAALPSMPASPGTHAESLDSAHQAVAEALAMLSLAGLGTGGQGTRQVDLCTDDQTQKMTVQANDPNGASSPGILRSGWTYTIIATGQVGIGGTPALTADAEYYYDSADANSTAQNMNGDYDVGLQVTGAAADPEGPTSSPFWRGSFDNHRYARWVIGTGGGIRITFIDFGVYTDNTGAFNVEIVCGKGKITDVPPAGGGCGCADAIKTQAMSDGGNRPGGTSPGPVRYLDGTIQMSATDLSSDSFGTPWGVTRSWTNELMMIPNNSFGAGTTVSQLPYLVKYGNGAISYTVVAVSNGTTARYFDTTNNSTFTAHYFVQDKLIHDPSDPNKEFVLTDTTGATLKFHNFDASLPEYQRGQLKLYKDATGQDTTTSRGANGKVTEVWRLVGGVRDSYVYTYYATGLNRGLVWKIALRRGTNSDPLNNPLVREVEYAYHLPDGLPPGQTQDFGPTGTLKLVQVKDGGGVIDTEYYRYYKPGEANGYDGGLKYVFRAASYDRMVQDGLNPLTAPNTGTGSVESYADFYFEYDSEHRVTKERVQGAGCSLGAGCSEGLGEYTFSYSQSSHADGYNSWKHKTVETLPDGNQNIVYSNFAGQTMLHVFRKTAAPAQDWIHFYKYDTQQTQKGRLLWHAYPSAVTGYNENVADLVWDLIGDGDYTYIHNNQGLIEVTDYYTSTSGTISETVPGDVDGYVANTWLQRGDNLSPPATKVKQNTTQYFKREVSGVKVFPVARQTVYRNTTTGLGSDQLTKHSYTWHAGTFQVAQHTVERPIVTELQNGPEGTVGDQTVTVYDTRGRATSITDPDGFVTTNTYDDATGAVTETVVNSGTSQLNLRTTYTVDNLGRTTKRIDPDFDPLNPDPATRNVTYTVYKDSAHEVRTYPGWDTTSAGCGTTAPCTTGPIQVTREDRGRGYTETLTLSGLPSVDPTTYLPTGNDPITLSTIKTLTRTQTNKSGQVTQRDRYFSFAGLASYTQDVSFGTPGTHLSRTTHDYDKGGREDRGVSANGTITRTEYDAPGRPIFTWIGTNDANWNPAANPPCSGLCDLRIVGASVYDGTDALGGTAGIGNGNLTQQIVYATPKLKHPDPEPADRRVTVHWYDWRDRRVASKQGAQTAASENSAVNRPLTYTEYDNLGQATAQELYDGDTTTLVDTTPADGVPDKPAQATRRARGENSYDEQGRVYQMRTFSVDQSSGALSTATLQSNTWYNRRGQVLKTAQPGGLVQKMAYDGAGRTVKTFSSDGGGDPAHGATGNWSHADDVLGDNVLTQTDTKYDGSGNVLLTTLRERFHDESAAGELVNPGTAPKARVYYVGSYYDKANRPTRTVNVGTNGGSAWSRPANANDPLNNRSDTVLVTDTSYNASGWAEHMTDPRGLVRRTEYDLAGRTAKTIEAYCTASCPADANRTTEYAYYAGGQVFTLKAVLPGGYQTTSYNYTGRTADGQAFNSNDLLVGLSHPHKTTGEPDPNESEFYVYNGAGQQRKARYDRNGTEHTYSYDLVGRLTADAITILGATVDGAVRRLETAYDTAGRPYLFTSYNAATGGTVVNEVKRDFNGLGQLTHEYQCHTGAVSGCSGGAPVVQYTYSELTGGANHSRLTKLTYPDRTLEPSGRQVNYTYTGTLDNAISRLTALTNGGTPYEQYAYLGLGTVVRRFHVQGANEIGLTYLAQGSEPNGPQGDKYNGLDRFGRVFDQRILDSGSPTTPLDRFQYGYDRNGNRLYRENLVNAAFSELYHQGAGSAWPGYDNFNQLRGFKRGTLNAAKDNVPSPSYTQEWVLDIQGNWDTVTTNGTPQNRTHNKQNQINTLVAYDPNGAMTNDEIGRTLTYDAWGRLVQVANGSTHIYAYDALGRRVKETTGTVRDLYYSAQWQVLEERVGGVVKVQNLWSPVYVDALIRRDRDTGGAPDLDEVLYVQQDANWNVTSVANPSGGVQERYVYEPYGKPTRLTAGWLTPGADTIAWVYLHQGGRYEAGTGLYHFRNRELSPTLGRWNRQDPKAFAAGDSNLYRYESSRPTTLTDSSGLQGVERYQQHGCCCAESIEYSYGPVADVWHERFGLVYGHHFKVTVKLNYVPPAPRFYGEPGSTCRLEWWERTNRPYTVTMPVDEWHDMVKDTKTSGTFTNWFGHLRLRGPVSIVLDDSPWMALNAPVRGRYLDFKIIVWSGQKANCKKKFVLLGGRQVLDHRGRPPNAVITQQDFFTFYPEQLLDPPPPIISGLV